MSTMHSEVGDVVVEYARLFIYIYIYVYIYVYMYIDVYDAIVDTHDHGC